MNSSNTISPKVSIIIAFYNDPDVLTAIKSAFFQKYKNKEIIVINDGSDSMYDEKIRSVKKFVDIYIEQDNQGQSIARNAGIKKATGEYILNWDSDDFFENSFCEKAVSKFLNDNKIKIVTCKAIRFNKEGDIDTFVPIGGYLDNFLFANAALGSSMFKRKDWFKCRGYEEELPVLGFEDWEFYISILKNGGYAYVIDEPLFHYQLRPGSTTQKIRNSKIDKFKYIILKHKELYQQNFEGLVNHFINKIKKEENERKKIMDKPEYRIGNKILGPLRRIRLILNKKIRNGKI